MSSSEPSRTGATATEQPAKRRRPWWGWLLLALLAVLIVIAILVLATQCATSSTGPPPGPASSPGALPPPAAPPAANTPPGGAPPAGDLAGVQSRVNQIVAAAPVTFLADSPELTTSGIETVDRVARELATVPAARVTVTGYAAPVGADDMPDPQQLSEQRATTVAQRLGAEGVAGDRVQTRGASDSDPLPTLAASRRAELTIS